MKLTYQAIEHIKKSEGLRLEAYPDPGSKDGLPVTIGYGTTRINGKAVPKNLKITKAQADQYFNEDINRFADQVRKLLKVKLSDNQFGALVSFAYNIGIEAFKNSTLLRLLNNGDFASVPAQLRRWNKNDGKVMKGLVNRREAEIALWNGSTTPLQSTEKPVERVNDSGVRDTGSNLLMALLRLLIKLFNGGK